MKTMQKLLFLALIYQALPSLLVAQPVKPGKSVTPDKPLIFSRLPDKFEYSASLLRQLFNAEVNDNINIPFPGNNSFKGIVNAKIQRDANVLSVNVFSSNFPGTLLNISLITMADKTEKMIGSFINPRNGDVLMIEQEKDHYYIRKDLQKFVMTECPLPGMIENRPEQ